MKHFQRQKKISVIKTLILCIISIIIFNDTELRQILVGILTISIVINGILSVWDFDYSVGVKNKKIRISEGKRLYQFELSSIKIDRGIMTVIISDKTNKMILNSNDEFYDYLDVILIQYLANQKNTS